jgi:hypothetical protein
MKVRYGLNPDFADFDELDSDVLEAFEDYDSGSITLDELAILVGAEAAEQHASMHSDTYFQLLDDPEFL